ncbi:hypothetical protein [Synechococcus sp. W4D4]|uniref:hypothetical protein n=1 Tax=Synechococcus sp. W4D4 TaxID=3392294 RepID=UPI0039EB6418
MARKRWETPAQPEPSQEARGEFQQQAQPGSLPMGLGRANQGVSAGGGAVDDRPITPHAVPIFDSDGNLTYVGDDGRRYVVGPLPETDEANVDRVMERLREGQALFSQIEQLSGQWLDYVSSSDLARHSALALLLTTLETFLSDPESDEDT